MDLNELLMQSAELQGRVAEFLIPRPGVDSARIRVSKVMCAVSFEHAESIKILVATGNFTSAVGLLRLQYETLVRAVWLSHAATDTEVSKLSAELNRESAKKADNLPLLIEMLKKLEGKLQQDILEQLLEIKEYSWKPLSSYVHGGLHAIDRHSKGYPLPLLVNVLKHSNGLALMAGNLAVILSGDPAFKGRTLALQKEFFQCLPDVAPCCSL